MKGMVIKMNEKSKVYIVWESNGKRCERWISRELFVDIINSYESYNDMCRDMSYCEEVEKELEDEFNNVFVNVFLDFEDVLKYREDID